MIIRDTGIPDVIPENVDATKIYLSDKIIEKVQPLFNEVEISKRSDLNEAKNNLQKKKVDVSGLKFELEELQTQYTKNKLMTQLLNKIKILVDSGLIYDGTLRNQTVILLKMMDKLEVEKLKHQIAEISTIINKRF